MKIIYKDHLEHQIHHGYYFNTSEYLSKGMDLFKKQMGNFILIEILIFLISSVPVISWVMPVNALRACQIADEDQKKGMIDELFKFDKLGQIIIFFLVAIVLTVLIILPLWILMMALGVGGAAAAEGMGSEAVAGIGAVAMVLIGIVFFLFVLTIPTFLYFSFGLLAFSDEEAITIIKRSYQLAKKNFWDIFLFNLILFLISILGLLFN